MRFQTLFLVLHHFYLHCVAFFFTTHEMPQLLLLSVVKSSLHASLCMFFICPVSPSFSLLSFFPPFFLLQCFPFCHQVICCHLFPFHINLFLLQVDMKWFVFTLCTLSVETHKLFLFAIHLKNVLWVMCGHCTGTEECYRGGKELEWGLFLLMGGDFAGDTFFS